jgi:hypothetical protein
MKKINENAWQIILSEVEKWMAEISWKGFNALINGDW